ncbi:MAG TPA: RNA polymerase sigma factor [Pseudolabrys sp.]|nr:RNA polymerase sigma factor [Pseudolabrys sp.]
MQPSQNAVEIALELNWSRLFGYAFSLTGDAEGARDLLQQSALNALASTNAPSDRKAARAWLFKIVRNAWIDQYRRQKLRTEDDSPIPIEGGGWDYEDRVIAEITVRQGLGKIDPLQREVIELVDLWGFRYADAATILGVPVGTVMSRLSRARLSLLEAMAGENLRPMGFLRGQRK